MNQEDIIRMARKAGFDLPFDGEDYDYPLEFERFAALVAEESLRVATPPAAPMQEPVAVCHDDGYWTPLKTEAGRRFNDLLSKAGSRINVYTTPPAAQRPWAGLTDEEAFQICVDCGCLSEDWLILLDAIETKLQEKNL